MSGAKSLKLSKKERYRIWKKWKKHNLNSRAYQLSVLFGFIASPTFIIEQSFALYEKERRSV